MNPTDPLSNLRDSIVEVDRALLELLRRRMDLAAEVGRVKAEANLPVVVRDVEDRVLKRARQHAEACGVSEEVMAGVYQAIIRGSVERQYRVGIELREQRGERVLIVGGAGGMGNWLRGFLELVGHRVEIADPAIGSLPKAAGRFAGLADVPDLDAYAALFLATPLGATAGVLGEVVERRPKGLVVEITSVKHPQIPALERARELGVRALALHPMFGPGKSLYEPLTFVLAVQGDAATEKKELAPFLAHPYTKLMAVPFPEHDRLMGWLLGLAHLVNIQFGAATTRSGFDPAHLHDCASATFIRQATTALLVLSENSDLYLDIQRLNPHRHEVYAAARESLDHIERMVEERDREDFRQTLEDARRALLRDG
jgi:chorismate mutase/prephenate dehydrogenase